MPYLQKRKAKVQYSGSYFWLIFWTLFFFPIAFILFFTKGIFEIDTDRYSVQYNGSFFWLCFWTVICFPIAICLFVTNGFSVVMQSSTSATISNIAQTLHIEKTDSAL